MFILAADTALGACSAALLNGDEALAQEFEPMERGHAEALAPMVESLMRKAAVPFSAIDRLAVTVGPGTFTGQRVGLAFMRGLKLALRRPLVGITTMSAMAHQAMIETGLPLAAALHDAKRGEVYFGLRDGTGELIPPAVAPVKIALDGIAGQAGGRAIALAGTAAQAARDLLMARGVEARLSSVRHPDALYVAMLARSVPEPESVPKPLYLRPSDARLPEPIGAIRNASSADLDTLARLHRACFAESWSAQEFARLLAIPGTFALLAGEGTGFVLARVAADEAEILSLGVSPESRHRGLGRALVGAAAERAFGHGAHTLFLEVSVNNGNARALYASLGFAEAGRRRAYYNEAGQMADALTLRSPLPLGKDA